MTPTQEQLDIITAAKSTKDNLIISALAGAAKTSTLVLIAKALGTTSTLCLAFNKKIQIEMEARLPSNCQARTLNSVGHRMWGDFLGKRLVIDARKTYRLLKDLVDQLEPKEKSEAYDSFSDLLRAIDGLKSAGWIPEGSFPHARPLMDDSEAQEWLDEIPTGVEWDLIRAVSILSMREAMTGTVDFNDQILCPTIFPASFNSFPLTMVDEAQDLSALNHMMLKKLVKNNRLIAVGDECQAIYGFRGAHEESMGLLKQQFNMTPLYLTISFRCPIKVVEAAKWRAPMMKYPDWAVEGTVTVAGEWRTSELPQNAAIICRNNAPLFSTAIRLLKNGRYPELVGNDIGKNLLKIMGKFGKPDMPQRKVMEAIAQWEDEKLKKARDEGKVHDQAACLRIFAEQGKDLGSAMLYAETIFNSSGPIKLMTGHKSKGLEFDDVYFLDAKLVGNQGQEKNLRYVIITRAKQNLTYINTEDFIDEVEETKNATVN